MRRVFFRTLVAVTAVIAGGTMGWSHPGHGADQSGTSFSHYLTEPLHVAPLLACAAAVFGIGAVARRRSR